MAAATSFGTTRRVWLVVPVLSFAKVVQVTSAEADPSETPPFCTVQSAALSAFPNQEKATPAARRAAREEDDRADAASPLAEAADVLADAASALAVLAELLAAVADVAACEDEVAALAADADALVSLVAALVSLVCAAAA